MLTIGQTNKKEVVVICEKLRSYFFNEYRSENQMFCPGLMTGLSGTILIQSLYFEVFNKRKDLSSIHKSIEELLDQLDRAPSLSSTFCNGLAGIGWLLCYLKDRGMIKEGLDELLEDCDNVLNQKLNEYLAENNYDLMNGAIGIGIYFLKRKKTNVVEKILCVFLSQAHVFGDAIVWSRQEKSKDGLFDLGVAHGNAGILFFLQKCILNNISSQECRKHAIKLTKFYFGIIQDYKNYGSFYPGSIKVEKFPENWERFQSRLAWCYGDLGILYNLYRTFEMLGEEESKRQVMGMLEITALRRNQESTNIIDTSFCHGSSGVGTIFNRLYRQTNKKVFCEAENYWANWTIYQYNEADSLNVSDPLVSKIGGSILNGIGGIALFLLCLLNNKDSDTWTECFFLL